MQDGTTGTTEAEADGWDSNSAELLNPDFFAYREDADAAWRAQLLGWHCLYVPSAVGYHVRTVVPGNRRAVPAVVNMHSVENRFLMRIKFWLPATVRDLLVVGGYLLWEQRSLPAFWRIAKCLPRALEQRRSIMTRRRVSDESLAQWFSAEPSAQPLPEIAELEWNKPDVNYIPVSRSMTGGD